MPVMRRTKKSAFRESETKHVGFPPVELAALGFKLNVKKLVRNRKAQGEFALPAIGSHACDAQDEKVSLPGKRDKKVSLPLR